MYGPVHSNSVGSTFSTTPQTGNSSSSFSSMFSTGNPMDILNLSGKQGEGKSEGFIGKIKDFGKGIFKGAVNTITSLFSLKGLLLTLGSVALVAVAGPIAIPLLIAGGLTVGGMQIAKGVMSGDWEKAGEGTFTVGATLLGAKMGPKSYKVNGTEYALAKNVKGTITPLNGKSGIIETTVAQLKSLLPGKSGKLYQVKDGAIVPDTAPKGAFSLAKDVAGSKFHSIKGKAGEVTQNLTGKNSKVVEKQTTTTTEQVQPTKSQMQPEKPLTEKYGKTETELNNAATKMQSVIRRHQAIRRVKQLKAEKAGNTTATSTEVPKKGIFDKFIPKMDNSTTAGVMLGATTAAGLGGGLMTAEEQEAYPPQA
jgi:hypothetical protein